MFIIKLIIILNLILYVKSQIFFQPKEQLVEDDDDDDSNIKQFLFKPLGLIRHHQPQLNLFPNNKVEIINKCGHVKPKISLYVANGRKTEHNLWPWNVQLIINPNVNEKDRNLDNKVVFCGGTIISKNHILTAAHCFDEIFTRKNVEIFKNNKKLLDLTARNTQIVFNSVSNEKKGGLSKKHFDFFPNDDLIFLT